MSRLGKFSLIFFVGFVAICVAFISTFSWNQISGTSMEPNLADGKYVLFWKSAKIQRGSVVLYHPNLGKTNTLDVLFIGRVIGMPGETIQVKDSQVWLMQGEKAQKIEESYLAKDAKTEVLDSVNQVTLGENEFLILHDKRFKESLVQNTIRADKVIGVLVASF